MLRKFRRADMQAERVTLLQEADAIVREILEQEEFPEKEKIWHPHWRGPRPLVSAVGLRRLRRLHHDSVRAWQLGQRMRRFSILLSVWSPLT